ncbi:hypothetical protein AVEN_270709-1 [Araneus ventricosus]|uniref:Uncharacterized protein n=1 Tax=Araneus ventricosus TaxID=182803 RepID=A0A4Y2FGN5_ARAVE|nr:hypothetical protein AVEN_270709-1 [Araneus ventricosus]
MSLYSLFVDSMPYNEKKPHIITDPPPNRNTNSRPRWPSDKVSVSGLKAPGSKPDYPEDPRIRGLLRAKSHVVAKRDPDGVVRKLGEGVPAQATPSPSDHGSKCRGPS